MDLYNNKDLFHFLSAYMQTNTRIKEVVIWDILNQCLDALVYLHNKDLIHRDIKLSNIFMNDTGKIVIGDFGHCAIMKNENLIKYTQNPEDQEILRFYCLPEVGSPGFQAPEIFSGFYDQKVDVYSLGVCMYCLCFQVLPPQDNCQTITNDNHYSYELKSIIEQMLKKDPNERPNSSDLYQIYKQKLLINMSLIQIFILLYNVILIIKIVTNIFRIHLKSIIYLIPLIKKKLLWLY